MMLRKSISPESLSSLQISSPLPSRAPLPSPRPPPGGAPTMKSGPTDFRMAVSTSRVKRIRFCEAAVVIVRARVGRRTPEPVEEMAVAFEFEAIEAGGLHAFGGGRIVLDDPRHVPILHLLRKGAMGGLAHRRSGENGEPVRLVPHGAAAEMGELDHHRRAMFVAIVGKLPRATARSRPYRHGDCRKPAANPPRRWPSPPSWSSAIPPFAFSA